MKLDIKKSFYNKSTIQEDGVTYLIDTEHDYPLYMVTLNNDYYDIEQKEDLIKAIISDLQSTITELQQVLKKEQNQELEK